MTALIGLFGVEEILGERRPFVFDGLLRVFFVEGGVVVGILVDVFLPRLFLFVLRKVLSFDGVEFCGAVVSFLVCWDAYSARGFFARGEDGSFVGGGALGSGLREGRGAFFESCGTRRGLWGDELSRRFFEVRSVALVIFRDERGGLANRARARSDEIGESRVLSGGDFGAGSDLRRRRSR